MKNNKKLIGLVIGLACVLICLILVLTMCGGNGDGGSTPTDPSGLTDTTGASQDPTSDTTVSVEETTAPVEETTAPTVGNSTPGGSGGGSGSSGGTTDTPAETTEPTEPNWEVADPGTGENPYIEAAVKLPFHFTTVTVPAKGSVRYDLYGAADTVITADSSDINVTYGGKTYQPTDGKLTLAIAADAQEPAELTISNISSADKAFTLTVSEPLGTENNPYTVAVELLPATVETAELKPGQTVYYTVTGAGDAIVTVAAEDVSIAYNGTVYTPENGVLAFQLSDDQEAATLAITNTGKEDAAFTLRLESLLGSAENPQLLEELGELTTSLVQGDEDGYHYLWTAPETGVLTLQLTGVTENTQGDAVLMNQTTGEQVRYSIDAVTHAFTGVTAISVNVSTGDKVVLNVAAQADAEGNIPASDITVTTELVGTASNPIQVFYPGFEAQIPAGVTLHFQGYRLAQIIATAEGKDFTVVHSGNSYTTAQGAVSFPVTFEGMFIPSVFVITNNADTTELCTVGLAYPEGTYSNPKVLETADLESISVSLEEGNDQGYYMTWTAPATGTVTFRLASIVPNTVQCNLLLNNTTTYQQASLAESTDGTVSMEVSAGDVIDIQLSVIPDEFFQYPAADVVIEGTYSATPGTEETPYELTLTELPASVETLERIAPETDVYYSIYGAGDTCLTVADANAYVIYNGVTYGADNTGKVVVHLAPGMGRFPTVLRLGNNGSESKKFTLEFVALPGSVSNPQQITSFENGLTVELPETDTDGIYYYTWTADETGVLKLAVNSASEGTAYDIAIYNQTSFLVTTLAEDGVNSEEETFVQNYVTEGDQVSIQVQVTGTFDAETGITDYPAAKLECSVYVTGRSPLDLTGETDGDPYFLSVNQCKLPIGGSSLVYISGYCYDQTLTVTGEDAYVEFNGTTYTSDENGVISFKFPAADGVGRPNPLSFAVGNSGEYAASFPVNVLADEGTYENPRIITSLNAVEVSLEEGNQTGYYLQFTAQQAGTLQLALSKVTEGVTCDVVLTNLETFVVDQLSESTDGTVSIAAAAGQTITIQVTVQPDKDYNYPAADITLTGSFTAAQ